MTLTPRQQRIVAQGVKQDDRRATEALLKAFRPLIDSLVARLGAACRDEDETEDMAGEMVIWTIELTKQWKPEVRNLDGYLKEFLRYKMLDRLKQMRRERARPSWHDEAGRQAAQQADPASTPAEAIEDKLPDDRAELAILQAVSSETAAQVIRRLNEELTDPYLRQMLFFKLQGWQNPEIAQVMGLDTRKVQNDWSRRVVIPILRPMFEQFGIAT